MSLSSLQASLPTVYNRRLQDIAILMLKLRKTYYRSNYKLFNINGDREKRYNLRNSDFTLPRFNTIKYGKHSLKYFGPFLWSKLTKEERGMESVSTFKRRIRKRDLTHLIEDGGCKNCYLCNSQSRKRS